MVHGSDPPSQFDELTPKQNEVLALLVEARTTKEIARELGISPSAVEQRVGAACRKMGVASRRELVRIYNERGDRASQADWYADLSNLLETILADEPVKPLIAAGPARDRKGRSPCKRVATLAFLTGVVLGVALGIALLGVA